MNFKKGPKDFYIYAGFILFVVLASSLWSGFTLYNSQRSTLLNGLISESQLIDTNFSGYLNYVSHIAEDKGHKIALHKGDLKYADDLFKRNFFFSVTRSGLKQKAFLWPHFSWVDKSGKILVKSSSGVLKNPEKIADAKHLYQSTTNPWQLNLSDPYLDKSSDKVFIDASLGVCDLKSEEYIGAILTRFSVEKLAEAIKLGLKEETKFIILDEEMRIIINSDEVGINHDNFFAEKLFGVSDDGFEVLKESLKYRNNIYKVYRKSSDYPFLILTGYDAKSFTKEFFANFIERFVSLFGAAFFVAIILFFQRKRIIKEEDQNKALLKEKNLELINLNEKLGHQNELAKKSRQSRDQFLSQIKQNIIEDTVAKITKDIAKILDYEEGRVVMQKQVVIDLNKKILGSCAKILSYVSDDLEFSYVNVHKIINDAIAMTHYDADVRGVKLSCQIQDDIEDIYVDERSIKHVIVTLINYAMKDRKANIVDSFVKVTANKNEEFLEITFEDNGHGISEEMRADFDKNDKSDDNISLSMHSIRAILSAHKGIFEIKNYLGKGSSMIVRIPYIDSSDQDENDKIENADIINLFPKK